MPYFGRILLGATVRLAEISLNSFLPPSIHLSFPASVPPPCPASFLLPFLPAVPPLSPLVKHSLAAISSTIHRLRCVLKKCSGEIKYHQALIKYCYWVCNYSSPGFSLETHKRKLFFWPQFSSRKPAYSRSSLTTSINYISLNPLGT